MATAAAATALPREKVQEDLFFIVSKIFEAVRDDPRFLFAIKGGAAVALNLNYIKTFGGTIPLPIPAENGIDMPFGSDIDTTLYTTVTPTAPDFVKNMQAGCFTVLEAIERALNIVCGTASGEAEAAATTATAAAAKTKSFAIMAMFDKTPAWRPFAIPNECPYGVIFQGPHTFTNREGQTVAINDTLIKVMYTKDSATYDVLDIAIPGEPKDDYSKLRPFVISLKGKSDIAVPVASLKYTYEDQQAVAKSNTRPGRPEKRALRAALLKPYANAENAAVATMAEFSRHAEEARRAAEAEEAARRAAEARHAAIYGPFTDTLAVGRTVQYYKARDEQFYLSHINGAKLPYDYLYNPREQTYEYVDGTLFWHSAERPRIFKKHVVTGQVWEYIYKDNVFVPKRLRRTRRGTRRARKQRRSTYRRK
jgi:hypothetical protein